MNGNGFDSLQQKGLKDEGGYVKTQPFYTEGDTTAKNVRVSPKICEIRTLADYFSFLKEIHDKNADRLKRQKKEFGSLFLYRGQGNVAFDYSPSILRSEKNIKREHLLCREFHRRFFETMDSYKTMFDEEVLMQHYGVGSRCLDLLESPLMALWAACETKSNGDFKNTYGEVSVWCLDYENEDLKAYDSSTVSVIVNTAKCERYFSLGNLAMEYHKEHPTEMQNFIYLKDVLRRTVVARAKYNNVHFTHQLNCFAVMNLNKLVDYEGNFQRKFGISAEQFSEYILNAKEKNKGRGEEYQKPNIARLREGKHTLNADFSELSPWDLWFEKEKPNDSPFVDSFDLYRYQYNDSENENERVPMYAIVPPSAKDSLIEELEYTNITNATVYPDMDIVAKEMLERYGLQIEKEEKE